MTKVAVAIASVYGTIWAVCSATTTVPDENSTKCHWRGRCHSCGTKQQSPDPAIAFVRRIVNHGAEHH